MRDSGSSITGIYSVVAGETGVSTLIYPVGDARRYGLGGTAAQNKAALQSAHDSLAAIGGGTVYLPNPAAGVWQINGTINWTAPNVNLEGGAFPSAILPTTAAFHTITLGAVAHRCQFRRIWFQGNAPDNTTIQTGIYTTISAPSDIVVESCIFGALTAVGNSINNGIIIDTGSRWNVRGNTFSYPMGAISGTGYGVLCATSTRVVIRDNVFTFTAGHGRHAAYLSGGSTKCRVINNDVLDCTEEAFPIYSRGAQVPNTNNVISGNFIDGGGQLTGASGAISLTGKCAKNLITRNTIRGFAAFGIVLTTAAEAGNPLDANEVSLNTIGETSWDCIGIYGATNTKILKNTLYGASASGVGNNPTIGIRLDGAIVANGTIVDGNITDQGTNARSGLFTEAGTTGTIMTNNRFPAGVIGTVELSGAVRGNNNDFNLPEISGDNGDGSVTIRAGRDAEIERFASALTANRTVTLDATNAFEGAKFRVVRTGLGAFTLDVGGLKTIPAGTAAWVDVERSSAAWVLTGYGTL